MPKAVDKTMHKLGTSFAQVSVLPTLSTGRRFWAFFGMSLYVAKRTSYARLSDLFAQPIIADFNLLSLSLYPVSTGPITNTKLIYKELSS
jgi:hypothetical protein